MTSSRATISTPPVSATPKVKGSTSNGHRVWCHGVAVLAICLLNLFLFYGLSGKTPVNCDDLAHREGAMQWNHVEWVQNRRYCSALLKLNYAAGGKSIEHGTQIWWMIYAISGFAAYASLLCTFSIPISLLGSLLWLSYSSKYEPLTWWAAGAYTLSWLSFFSLLPLVYSKWKLRTKSIAIAAVVYVGIHVYEIIAPITPLLGLLLLRQEQRAARRITRSALCFAILPLAVVAAHLVLMVACPGSIFQTRMPAGQQIAPINKRISKGLTTAFGETVGRAHFIAASSNVKSFERFYSKEQPGLGLIFAAALIAAGFALLVGVPFLANCALSTAELSELAGFGLGTLLFSGAISFVSNYLFTPSRLTGMPVIGLVYLLCALLQLCAANIGSTTKWRRLSARAGVCIGICVSFAWCWLEACSLAAILRQAAEVHDFDDVISRQIVSLHPILKQEERLLVSMPLPNEQRTGRWTTFGSGYDSTRAFEPLADLYHSRPVPDLVHCIRTFSPCESEQMRRQLPELEEIGWSNVVPFYVDRAQKVFAVTAIEFTNDQDHLLKSVAFSEQHRGVSPTLTTTQAVRVGKYNFRR